MIYYLRHFVKRPFAHQFKELYFVNPKAEEFKWWTGKFLDHGLVELWKRLCSHQLTLREHQWSLSNRLERSNSSSAESEHFYNFIGQVHLFPFYNIILNLTAICVAVFVWECLMQNAQQLSVLVLIKLKQFSIN
jgi:hypothetical protein